MDIFQDVGSLRIGFGRGDYDGCFVQRLAAQRRLDGLGAVGLRREPGDPDAHLFTLAVLEQELGRYPDDSDLVNAYHAVERLAGRGGAPTMQ